MGLLSMCEAQYKHAEEQQPEADYQNGSKAGYSRERQDCARGRGTRGGRSDAFVHTHLFGRDNLLVAVLLSASEDAG